MHKLSCRSFPISQNIAVCIKLHAFGFLRSFPCTKSKSAVFRIIKQGVNAVFLLSAVEKTQAHLVKDIFFACVLIAAVDKGLISCCGCKFQCGIHTDAMLKTVCHFSIDAVFLQCLEFLTASGIELFRVVVRILDFHPLCSSADRFTVWIFIRFSLTVTQGVSVRESPLQLVRVSSCCAGRNGFDRQHGNRKRKT